MLPSYPSFTSEVMEAGIRTQDLPSGGTEFCFVLFFNYSLTLHYITFGSSHFKRTPWDFPGASG